MHERNTSRWFKLLHCTQGQNPGIDVLYFGWLQIFPTRHVQQGWRMQVIFMRKCIRETTLLWICTSQDPWNTEKHIHVLLCASPCLASRHFWAQARQNELEARKHYVTVRSWHGTSNICSIYFCTARQKGPTNKADAMHSVHTWTHASLHIQKTKYTHICSSEH